MKSVIECHGIGKSFISSRETCRALNDLSFTIEKGKITGLLGPDGAGKTTLLRILAGLFVPDTGHATVLGFDTVKKSSRIQRIIGYMPQKFGLYENLSVEENLTLYAELHAVPREKYEKRSAELLDMTALAPFRQRMAGKLSGGMKQKLALACSLISDPPLLLLDEPTVGVDVLSRRELWQILKDLTGKGHLSVFVSTSYMDEAVCCDRTLILYNGSLIADAPPSEIAGTGTFEAGFLRLLTGKELSLPVRKKSFSMDSPILVRADNMVKKFGNFVAVDHVSFDVRKGEIFGLLGANGAGKTTTFRMLCGLSSADGGTIEIGGVNLRRAPGSARKKLGYVAQKFSLYNDLTVLENLEFFGGAYGLRGDELKERIDTICEEFSLKEIADHRTAGLPPGIKQRLSMGCALLHKPDILFLDEATSGADPLTRREFWLRIMNLADSGVAVIITTHFLDEAEFCDRMVIMHSGRTAASGTADEIRKAGNSPLLEEAFVNIIARAREEARNK